MKSYFPHPVRQAVLGLGLVLFAAMPPCRAGEMTLGYALRPGDNHRGIPLIRPALHSGTIASIDSSGFRIRNRSFPPTRAADLTAWGREPCYLEIESCPADRTLEGERWEVDTGKSLSMPGFFALKAEPWNTRPDLPPALAGASYSIRPHWTVEALFPPVPESDVLRASQPDQADQIAIFDPSQKRGFRIFYARELSPGPRWRWEPVGASASLSTTIPPGTGWYFHRETNRNLNLVLSGQTRGCALRIPLRQGSNLIAPGLERSVSLRHFAMGPANGFRGDPQPGRADRISLFRGSVVDTFALLTQPVAGWVSLRSLRGVDPEAAMQVRPDDAVQILKTQADPDFLIPLLP